MARTDIEYANDGFTVSLYPITSEGITIWNEIATHFGGVASFPVHMFPSIRYQITAAGYTVRKARKSKVSADDLMRELGI